MQGPDPSVPTSQGAEAARQSPGWGFLARRPAPASAGLPVPSWCPSSPVAPSGIPEGSCQDRPLEQSQEDPASAHPPATRDAATQGRKEKIGISSSLYVRQGQASRRATEGRAPPAVTQHTALRALRDANR